MIIIVRSPSLIKYKNEAQTAMKEPKSFDRQFKMQVDKISTEIILEDSASKIDFTVELT